MPPLLAPRRRKWLWFPLAVSTATGCIRFRNDAPPGADAAIAADAEADVESPTEGGDVVVIPPPVCSRFSSGIAESIASDVISELISDCLLRRHFANLPPVAVIHFQECLTAQIGQVM